MQNSKRSYIANLPVGFVERAALEAVDTHFDSIDLNNLPNGLVTGGNLVQFDPKASPELKSAVALSLLAAQRVAATDTVLQTPDQWLQRHNTVLQNLNWTITQRKSVTSNFDHVNVAVHKAIIPLLAAALGPAAASGSLIITALSQLQEMQKDAPWITLFERQSRRFEISEFLFSVVETGIETTTLNLAAARFDLSYGRTQILFFQLAKENAKFDLASASLAANTSLLAVMNEDLQIKLSDHARNFIRALDVGPVKTPNSGDDAEAADEAGGDRQSFGTALEGLEASRPWRPAKSLLLLRRQIDAMAPNRLRESDGLIGNAEHQSRASDHNPWVTDGGMGVVTAMDITHDPERGCDASVLAHSLEAARDTRIKYVIFNRRIMSSSVQTWTWRPYTGANPHDKHMHVSVLPDKAAYDSDARWNI